MSLKTTVKQDIIKAMEEHTIELLAELHRAKQILEIGNIETIFPKIRILTNHINDLAESLGK